ncbi:hypothetical protein DCAR_0520634 [Daucus carota subsp. sativus]|uniref:Uncharacterized protein n=1 Tax=Daucus carota subsp. sativus TaxID=79200 RepID=A0A161YM96_DAUCS|nr:hypothetical protein DCAR_0520634 [Daucus carota subsp. sativus]
MMKTTSPSKQSNKKNKLSPTAIKITNTSLPYIGENHLTVINLQTQPFGSTNKKLPTEINTPRSRSLPLYQWSSAI